MNCRTRPTGPSRSDALDKPAFDLVSTHHYKPSPIRYRHARRDPEIRFLKTTFLEPVDIVRAEIVYR